MSVLLPTKFYLPPIPAGFVPRPQLFQKLDEALSCRLTLVSAPAGAGKTTLVSAWSRAMRKKGAAAFGWLSLDDADNSFKRFWEYLAACIEEEGVRIDQAGTPLVEGEAGIGSGIPVGLIGGLMNLEDELVLVLDDYHLIQNKEIHTALGGLLEHMPPRLHLILLTRSDPPLELARLRVSGQLVEIRMEQLRFSASETSALLRRSAAAELTDAQIATLNDRTEGWAAGLCMAAISLRGHADAAKFVSAFAGSHRFVFDYLLEEVLNRQTPAVRNFLLQTSVLEKFNAPLCEAVTGNSLARSLLDTLERENLFLVPLDDERGWYRYHQLFADLLRVMLEQFDPGLEVKLRRRASDWFAARDMIPEALRQALAAGEMGLVARLVASNVLALVDQSELIPVLMQMDAAPSAQSDALPWLDVAYAWALAYSGQMERVDVVLGRAERQLETLAQPERAPIGGHIAAVRAYANWVQGRQPESVSFAREAARLLPAEQIAVRALNLVTLGNAMNQYQVDPDSLEVLEQSMLLARQSGQNHVFMLAASGLAFACANLGQLNKSHAVCQEAISVAEAYRRETRQLLYATASIYAELSNTLIEWGETGRALQLANQGLALAERWGQADTIVLCLLNQINALSVVGDLPAAQKSIERARRLAAKVSDWFVLNVDELEVRLWLDAGDMRQAERAVQGAVGEVSVFLRARLLIMQNRPRDIQPLLPQMSSYPVFQGIFRSLVLFMEKDETGAFAELEKTLALAEPENRIMSFVRAGETMERLLRLMLGWSNHAEFVQRLLSAFEARRKGRLVQAEQPLVESLSERELEILSLLDGPLSTPEIAEKLFVSANTVRTHIKNIYSKLGVHGRSEAVRRAQALGLLAK